MICKWGKIGSIIAKDENNPFYEDSNTKSVFKEQILHLVQKTLITNQSHFERFGKELYPDEILIELCECIIILT